ncbi:MAG: thiamine pyrophosphate-binding protein [Acidobacteriota bacterium]
MKLSDYVFSFLADRGVRHVFLVTGGGAMHLNDSLRKERRITPICQHHEQACAMAAEGYARVTGTPGVVSVTTGPGGINALNGVFGAWTDSIPMLVISGQVKRETCMAFHEVPGLRQLGDQEADIVSMVKGITKYAATVRAPEAIRYQLEKAWHLCRSGRSGPCWLDIPMDVQGSTVEPEALAPYDPSEDQPDWELDRLPELVRQTLDRLSAAERPVVMAGTGVRLAGAADLFLSVAERLRIPVTTAWTHDLIPSDHPLYCGRPGTIGTRAGNFTVQNADCLLVIGSRLNIRQVSYAWQAFAPHAFLIQVDADRAELAKPTVRPHLAIACDAKRFLEEMNGQLEAAAWDAGRHAGWLQWCRERVMRYPPVLPRQRTTEGGINPYFFVEALFGLLAEDDVVVCGNATATIVPFQAAALKRGQRLFSNSGSASMGYDLPAAIGAAVARGGKRVICLAGDGSLQMNAQELQTVVHHHLPVKLFVLDNGGYLSIRTTQKNFFGELIGESPQSGVSFPDPRLLAEAYGLPAVEIEGEGFQGQTEAFLDAPGPGVARVVLDPRQTFEPRPSSRQLPDGRIVSAPLHDMAPFLEREALAENLLGPLLDEYTST